MSTTDISISSNSLANTTGLALLALLCERWPKCFVRYQARRRPLKVGIHRDILAALGDAVMRAELSRALRIYVANAVYRARLKEGVARIDLDGQPVGIVTAAEATPVKRNPPKRKPPAPSPPPKPPPVKHSSLADLREAAHKRKQAMEGAS
jgi:sRNA-binding protein